jgi:hypothetical protein
MEGDLLCCTDIVTAGNQGMQNLLPCVSCSVARPIVPPGTALALASCAAEHHCAVCDVGPAQRIPGKLAGGQWRRRRRCRR